MSEDAPTYDKSKTTVVSVKLKWHDDWHTYQDSIPYEESGSLVIRDAKGNPRARFELRDVQHWHTSSDD